MMENNIVERKYMICVGNNNRIYFKDKGYLCSGEYSVKNPEDIKDSTLKKHGLYERQK